MMVKYGVKYRKKGNSRWLIQFRGFSFTKAEALKAVRLLKKKNLSKDRRFVPLYEYKIFTVK